MIRGANEGRRSLTPFARVIRLVQAENCELDPMARFVALTVGSFLNGNGVAWPSLETLVRRSGLSKSALRRKLDLLTEGPHAMFAKSKGRRSMEYRLIAAPDSASTRYSEGASTRHSSGRGALSDTPSASSDPRGASTRHEGVPPRGTECLSESPLRHHETRALSLDDPSSFREQIHREQEAARRGFRETRGDLPLHEPADPDREIAKAAIAQIRAGMRKRNEAEA